MRITSIQLTNFKRFTDLIIKDIPTASKLVLLIGSNGSGKSSLFDAFEYINRAIKREALSGYEVLDGYFKKKKDLDVFVKRRIQGTNATFYLCLFIGKMPRH